MIVEVRWISFTAISASSTIKTLVNTPADRCTFLHSSLESHLLRRLLLCKEGRKWPGCQVWLGNFPTGREPGCRERLPSSLGQRQRSFGPRCGRDSCWPLILAGSWSLLVKLSLATQTPSGLVRGTDIISCSIHHCAGEHLRHWCPSRPVRPYRRVERCA